MGIVDVATEEAERRNARVTAVHLKLGQLSGVVAGALTAAFELARESTPLADAVLVIVEIPVAVFCPVRHGRTGRLVPEPDLPRVRHSDAGCRSRPGTRSHRP